MMNKGKRLNEIIHSVKISDDLLKLPWLRPVDDPEFLIRMVWRDMADGGMVNMIDCYLPKIDESKVWVELSGGVEVIVKKALNLSNDGNDKLAAHLIETAFYADETNEKIHEARKLFVFLLSRNLQWLETYSIMRV